MMSRFALTLLVFLVLPACAAGPYGPGHDAHRQRPPVGLTPSGEAQAGSVTYTCEDNTTVVLTERQSTAQVTLGGSGMALSLARMTGGHYGAAPFEFFVRGGGATMVNNNKPVRCRAQ